MTLARVDWMDENGDAGKGLVEEDVGGVDGYSLHIVF